MQISWLSVYLYKRAVRNGCKYNNKMEENIVNEKKKGCLTIVKIGMEVKHVIEGGNKKQDNK